ncbi:hypothetical protein SUGI_1160120, partial [Cryptomeria japonica]
DLYILLQKFLKSLLNCGLMRHLLFARSLGKLWWSWKCPTYITALHEEARIGRAFLIERDFFRHHTWKIQTLE